MSRIDPWDAHDIAWREAERAIHRRPHSALTMLSLDSLGPLKSWCCPVCSRFGTAIVEYTTTRTAPQCEGGLEYF